MQERRYGNAKPVYDAPDLTAIQTESYERFIQARAHPSKRRKVGLEALLRDTFPVESYDGTFSIEYLWYELGRPRHTRDECKKLGLTYGMPFKVRVRMTGAEPIEETVYFGDIPIMLHGGEFIINGSERVIVSQLHRSPGADFSEDVSTAGKKVHSCRIVPEWGSWLELSVSKRDELVSKVDSSQRFPASCLLKALSEKHGTHADILREFYKTKRYSLKRADAASALKGKCPVETVVSEESNEPVCRVGEPLTPRDVRALKAAGQKACEVIEQVDDPLILNTILIDDAKSYEDALLTLYGMLRPGNPPIVEKARQLITERFFDPNRYRLGPVGRFRIHRRFGEGPGKDEMCLTPQDVVNCIHGILAMRAGKAQADEIDDLGNRRVRTIDELARDNFRKGFAKLRHATQERMSRKDREGMTPRLLMNAKIVSSTIDSFFGTGELSQVVDQVNPLAQLTHERRLSALGPGGLHRKRAGFEVRDVHPSHYGRICPIETPEGPNIGLIVSLALLSEVDEYGFLTTPFRKVKSGVVTDEFVKLRADQEAGLNIAPADTPIGSTGRIQGREVLVRCNGEMAFVTPAKVDFVDVSTSQLVGVSASLIPFLEHDDANRALMGSNMQRQAVPLLVPEPPIVATGVERIIAQYSGMVVKTERAGTVTAVTADKIVVGDQQYDLQKFTGLNSRTCLNQRPLVRVGQSVKKNEIIADGAGTREGQLSLGRNVLVAFMPWEGYNFEDAIVINERLVKEDAYTSIHVDEYEAEIRETKLGREEFTRDIPNVSERQLGNLDADGIVRVGTKVGAGDILVGKVTPKSKSELTAEEKLLYAIFGKQGEDVKNDSLEVPSGCEGIVTYAEKFSRKSHLSDGVRKEASSKAGKAEKEFNAQIAKEVEALCQDLRKVVGGTLKDREGNPLRYNAEMGADEVEALEEALDPESVHFPNAAARKKARTVYEQYSTRIDALKDRRDRKINKMRRGDELPAGVLEMVKVSVVTKRALSVGDKMAGRHGNKGVLARAVPEEDMPFLEDGTPIEMILNPLGVPSRMNVGQLLETHLGWAASRLGFRAITPVFDAITEEGIHDALEEAGLPRDGKVSLYDGRSGEPFDQKVTVGQMYMLKLHHLVDEKVHARATGPYSLITQQPLGGKARFGGQRFGEMEVWALEAYGAANILQELLTVKSDDVEGRTRIYESMVKGENVLEAGMPVAFDVLTNEIRGLCLDLGLKGKRTDGTSSEG